MNRKRNKFIHSRNWIQTAQSFFHLVKLVQHLVDSIINKVNYMHTLKTSSYFTLIVLGADNIILVDNSNVVLTLYPTINAFQRWIQR